MTNRTAATPRAAITAAIHRTLRISGVTTECSIMRENGHVMKSIPFLLIALVGAAFLPAQTQPQPTPITKPPAQQPAERSVSNAPALSLSDLSSSLEVLVNRVRPAVVQIFS